MPGGPAGAGSRAWRSLRPGPRGQAQRRTAGRGGSIRSGAGSPRVAERRAAAPGASRYSPSPAGRGPTARRRRLLPAAAQSPPPPSPRPPGGAARLDRSLFLPFKNDYDFLSELYWQPSFRTSISAIAPPRTAGRGNLISPAGPPRCRACAALGLRMLRAARRPLRRLRVPAGCWGAAALRCRRPPGTRVCGGGTSCLQELPGRGLQRKDTGRGSLRKLHSAQTSRILPGFGPPWTHTSFS